MDEDCSQMLRDIRVQGPPRISRCKKVRDIRGLRDIRVRTSRGYLVKVRDIRGVRDIRVQGPRGYLVRDIRGLRDIRVLHGGCGSWPFVVIW